MFEQEKIDLKEFCAQFLFESVQHSRLIIVSIVFAGGINFLRITIVHAKLLHKFIRIQFLRTPSATLTIQPIIAVLFKFGKSLKHLLHSRIIIVLPLGLPLIILICRVIFVFSFLVILLIRRLI
jgi:hypothetical protein